MTEQEIRAHTCSIQEAYREMTGIRDMPTISEFLSMRSAAINEIQQGICFKNSEPTGIPKSMPRPGTIEPIDTRDNGKKAAESAGNEPTHTPQLHRGTSKVVNLNKVKQPTIQETPATEKEEEEISEFEILKKAGNPWN